MTRLNLRSLAAAALVSIAAQGSAWGEGASPKYTKFLADGQPLRGVSGQPALKPRGDTRARHDNEWKYVPVRRFVNGASAQKGGDSSAVSTLLSPDFDGEAGKSKRLTAPAEGPVAKGKLPKANTLCLTPGGNAPRRC